MDNLIHTSVVVIAGKRDMDEILHRADLFEAHKAFASVMILDITRKEGGDIGALISKVVQAFQDGNYRVVAAFVPGVHDGHFLDETVQAVSDGRRWTLLTHLLKAHGFVKTRPWTLEQKLEKAIYHSGDYFVMEMPADADFLYHEGVAMKHCLEMCCVEYAQRIQSGSQRQFSVVDRTTGQPVVDIELSVTQSSYRGRVKKPVITQVRGRSNQCPPDDRYLPVVVGFIIHMGFELGGHGVPNFDGRCDGDLVLARWTQLMAKGEK